MTQVVIVGAGPTGSTLALLLSQRGVVVKLVEAARNFERLFRGEGLMPSGLDALEQMGLLKLLKDVPHREIDAWEFVLSGRTLFRVEEPIEPGGRQCTTISQPHLLPAIIQQAKTYSSFEFIQGEPVQNLLYAADRVAGVKLASGQEIKADLVIGSDGRNSLIRKKAGLNLTKLQNALDILWFKLDSGSLAKSKNTFYSILHERHGFGLFRASQGQLHIGWGLHNNDDYDPKQVNWADKLVATSPPWLAEHLLTHRESLTEPLLLSVVVGRCDRWSKPGLILLGDAAHPMSPVRAQGINMALRDAIVAANHLVPLLNSAATDLTDLNQIDAALSQIQQEREPEIICIQKLQAQEIAQAEKLRNSAFLRWGARTFTPIIRPGILTSWLKRQKSLRLGVTKVSLNP